ncbi:hypothetical protein RUM44_009894 [Polyplax serrata]|uniref:Fibrinogen C-terminal domain-containing protein n=1 Tax=Polyplax serrata TaxID=468196 RepID=A0ABR1ATZ0_POLSC
MNVAEDEPHVGEQYLFNVFEVIISTLESKLQRIENLDRAVEHLMRRIESIDSRVTNNIVKTDSVISKLRTLDQKLFQNTQSNEIKGGNKLKEGDNTLDQKLSTLDKKVNDIDKKLGGLKTQLEQNVLSLDDIKAEASEKKPIHMNLLDASKAIGNEISNQVTKEVKAGLQGLENKINYQLNGYKDNMNRMLVMVEDIHYAIVEPRIVGNKTTPAPATSKIDRLAQKMNPILSVSEKMDEVWDVVVGTKSSVDDLVPKSDELLTQTQRQERAISNIHNDLRTKANKIIENLNLVDKRLKKQEDEVMNLATRPVPAEFLLDPTIDRLVEYDNTRYTVDPEPSLSSEQTEQPLPVSFTTPTSTISTSTQATTTTPSPFVRDNGNKATHRGIIFPSVKNKPSLSNTTFTTDAVATIKDIKGFSCSDILNAGMRESGVYYLQIRGTTYWFLKVYCEQGIEDGGWTVIQRRDDFGEPRENFNRDWNDYKNGFGDPAKEFWLGNENIYMLTNNEDYVLRIELEDFEGNKRYAQYSHFKIYSEAEYYKLEIDGYEGNAGDSLNDPWYGSNNSPFSTYNRDNDRSSLNCASMLKGGWWWKSCGRGLNGLYLSDPQDIAARQGIVWFRWRGWDYTLKRASMMIRPKGILTST